MKESLNVYDSFSQYNSEFYIVKKDEKEGVVNIDGKEVVPPIYAQILGIGDVIVVTENFVSFESSGISETGIYSLNGTLLLPCEYEYIDTYFEEGIGRIYKDGKWGAINLSGNIILPIEYDDVRVVAQKGNPCLLVFDKNLPYWNEPTNLPYVDTTKKYPPYLMNT